MKVFNEPEIEILLFEKNDVIVTSDDELGIGGEVMEDGWRN